MEHFIGFTALISVATLITIYSYRYRTIGPIIWSAFIIRTLLALTHAYLLPLPDSQADAIMFEKVAWEMAQDGFKKAVFSFTTGAFFYSWIISLLYALTDRSPLMMQAINVFLGSMIVFNVYRISLIIFNNKSSAKRAAWLTVFFPTLALYSAITLREAFFVYFMTLGIIEVLLWWNENYISHFVKALIYLVLATAFHTGALPLIGILGILLVLRIFSAILHNRLNSFLRSSFGICILAFAILGIIVSGWGLEKIGLLKEGLDHHQSVAARGRAAYLQNLTTNTIFDICWQVPIRIVYFLFTPFPWWIRDPIDLIGVFDAILYIWLFLKIFRNRQFVISNSHAKVISLFLLAGIVVFSLATSNYGTAIRHRAKFAPLLISLAAERFTIGVSDNAK